MASNSNVRTNDPTKVPALPRIPADTPPSLRRYLELLEQTTNIRLGRRGDPRDRAVTLRELIDSGLATELAQTPFDSNRGGNPGFVQGGSKLPDLAVPPVVAGFTAAGAFSTIIISFTFPAYSNHSHTEIWSHTSDSIGDATLVGIQTGRVFTDPVGSGVTRYYWARHVNTDSVVGPFNAAAGTVANTATDVAHLLTILNNSIPAAAFATGLEPISVVNSLPTASGYSGPNLVFLTSDKKLYRYNSSGPSWTTAVPTTDLSGTIAETQIAADAVTNAKIATDAIQGDVIAANAITTVKINDTAISAAKIASNAVTAVKINAGAVVADKIATNAVTAIKINADAVTADKIATNAVTADAVNAGAITAGAIAAGAINATDIIADNMILADAIAADQITSAKIATGAVTADSITTGAITTDKIAANAVNASKLVLDNSTITSQTIGGVPTVIIKDLGVGSAKIANGAIGDLQVGTLTVYDVAGSNTVGKVAAFVDTFTSTTAYNTNSTTNMSYASAVSDWTGGNYNNPWHYNNTDSTTMPGLLIDGSVSGNNFTLPVATEVTVQYGCHPIGIFNGDESSFCVMHMQKDDSSINNTGAYSTSSQVWDGTTYFEGSSFAANPLMGTYTATLAAGTWYVWLYAWSRKADVPSGGSHGFNDGHVIVQAFYK